MKYYYDWKKIQKEYDEGLSFSDLNKKYGISKNALNKAKKKGRFKSRTLREAADYFYKNKKASNIKYKCNICDKTLSTQQGLKGHIFRSHDNLENQRKYANQASLKYKEKYEKIGYPKHLHSNETKELLSKYRINHLSKRKFFSKPEYYKGIKLDSSYEVVVAKSLDKNNIKWERPNKGLRWVDNNQNRIYLPDFYLPDFDVYLDPKNDWLIEKDKRKIKLTEEYNNVRIIILNKENLEWNKIKLLL